MSETRVQNVDLRGGWMVVWVIFLLLWGMGCIPSEASMTGIVEIIKAVKE